MRSILGFVLFVVFVAVTGCNQYVTPGRGAPMEAFGVDGKPLTDSAAIAKKLEARPLATFPATIAVVRVQEPNYHSRSCETAYGSGRYSVVMSRDVEPADTLQRLNSLPMIASVGPINRLLLNPKLESDRDVREAAAAIHAQMTLIYTIDTVYKTRDYAAPLSIVTLGLSPNESAHASTTVSAVLMDTRTGYIYSIAEGTSTADQLANAWTSASAADDVRKRAETKAFEQMLGEFEKSWKGVVETYAVKEVK